MSNVLMNNDTNRGKRRKHGTTGEVQIKYLGISQQCEANKPVSQEKYLVSAGIVAPETEVACLIFCFVLFLLRSSCCLNHVVCNTAFMVVCWN